MLPEITRTPSTSTDSSTSSFISITSSTTEKSNQLCFLDEITQYVCQRNVNEVLCYPIFRRFLRCEGQPNVEITHSHDLLGRPILRSPPERVGVSQPSITLPF